MEKNQYTDLRNIKYHDYEYCASRNDDYVHEEEEIEALQFRKIEFILNEILSDMGISKAHPLMWILNLVLASMMLYFRMIVHYAGQYVLLKLLDCPVSDVLFKVYKLKIIYGYHLVW